VKAESGEEVGKGVAS